MLLYHPEVQKFSWDQQFTDLQSAASHVTVKLTNRHLSRRLDRCDRMIHNESRDPNGGNVYYVTMQITLLSRRFRNVERNLHCDVVYITTVWVSSLTLDGNGVFAIKAYWCVCVFSWRVRRRRWWRSCAPAWRMRRSCDNSSRSESWWSSRACSVAMATRWRCWRTWKLALAICHTSSSRSVRRRERTTSCRRWRETGGNSSLFAVIDNNIDFEDVAIFIRSDKNGQDQEWVHQRDSTGGKVWRENTRGKTEMVWTPSEERWWVYWEKDAEDGVARKEETGKAKKEVYGCGERGHGWGWSDGGGYSW